MSSSKRTAVTALLAFALGATPLVAQAQTDAQKDEAKELFSAGLDLRDGGDEKAALQKFKQAYGIVRSPITTLEYGRSLMLLGHLVEARARLREAVSLPAKSNESPQAKAARTEATKLAEALDPRIPTIVITLDGVDDADVTIDGRKVAHDGPIPLDPGPHAIHAKDAAGTDASEQVDLKEGDRRTVALKFAGTSSSPTTGGPSTLTYAAFGVAGGCVLVGSIAGLMAKSKASDLGSSTSCVDHKCGADQFDNIDAYHRLTTTSTIAFVLGGVAAGVGVVSLLTSSGSEPERPKTAYATPWIGLGSVGIGGAF